ncbi:hypothetical protein GOBAR_AA11728 [Gossypium barbadense]|uniref:Uncharacterized protein n=1 Tax=Gossypium barbadense TaxID=3634 RepID=A0A2P5Y047_GOSBA|nr:hypothetical protein GOBAR_AA11728 [Gossypium barbadense]
MSETHFQNTETALKNQQASIQGLKTQILQLAKLIFARPEGSLLSNTESNPMEQLNVIAIQDKEGLVTSEPELRQETVVSKGKGEVNHSKQKPVNSHFVWETKQSPFKLETRSKNTPESCSSNDKGPIYEKRRLQLEELDERRTHKLRTHDKPKPCHDELNISPNQLKVGDKVLLDAADPRIATSEPNGAIPLTVLNIFPYGMRSVNSSHRHDHGTKRFSNPQGRALGRAHTTRGGTAYTMSTSRGKKNAIPALKKRKGVTSSSSPTVEIRHPFLQFHLGP